jgi:hypothetical protein
MRNAKRGRWRPTAATSCEAVPCLRFHIGQRGKRRPETEGEMTQEHHPTDRLREALRNVDFPAGKDELIRAAQAAGASDDLIRALRAIPPEEYANRAEVARAIPVDPAAEAGLSPAQRAEQAREQRHHGGQHLSQYAREVPKPPVEEAEEDLDR